MKRALVVSLTMASLLLGCPCQAATFKTTPPSLGRHVAIRIEGPIAPGDAVALARFAGSLRPVDGGLLEVHSAGGDFKEALAIGRWVRSHKLTAVVQANDRCVENCVFILAGGVFRMVGPSSVVLARPSLSSLPKEGVATAMKARLHEARAYMDEMNVSVDLAEAIFSAGHGRTHIVSTLPLFELGLFGQDPVNNEEAAFATAKRMGISRTQLASRQKRSSEVIAKRCARLDVEKYLACWERVRARYGL